MCSTLAASPQRAYLQSLTSCRGRPLCQEPSLGQVALLTIRSQTPIPAGLRTLCSPACPQEGSSKLAVPEKLAIWINNNLQTSSTCGCPKGGTGSFMFFQIRFKEIRLVMPILQAQECYIILYGRINMCFILSHLVSAMISDTAVDQLPFDHNLPPFSSHSNL